MGFPTWTLWGMGITAAGTLVMLLLAYLAQSPRLIARLGLSGLRLDLRVRALTGYALALLLLSFGFFLAGVPLGPRSEGQETAAVQDTPEQNVVEGTIDPQGVQTTADAQDLEDIAGAENEPTRPASGAFAGLPPSAQTATAEILAADAEQPDQATEDEPVNDANQVTQTATSTATETPIPSPTPSPTPTTTPTPTLTPTPIFEETAVINTGGSTLWLKRTPGGRDHVLVRGGDIVILYPGHANVGGVLWREVSTTDGVVGWVLESFLNMGEDTDTESSA